MKAIPESCKGCGFTHIAEYNATEQVAKALKDVPRDSIPAFLSRVLAALPKK